MNHTADLVEVLFPCDSMFSAYATFLTFQSLFRGQQLHLLNGIRYNQFNDFVYEVNRSSTRQSNQAGISDRLFDYT